jgi:peptide/nickel transport system substrate-binding protein
MYRQDVAQNSMASIVPDLATGWSWNEEGAELTLPLRPGVRWHDGKPFTAKDVKCTWDLLTGRSAEKLRLNPRKTWYGNLEEVTANGEYEVTFRLKRPQPSFLALLASGWSPVYPCHVLPREMRAHPIGTGPFKFVEFRPNEYIRVTRNPDYWKPGRPYLDGIEWPIVPSLSTRILGFVASRFDQVFGVTIPLLQDLQTQAPQAVCNVCSTAPESDLRRLRHSVPFRPLLIAYNWSAPGCASADKLGDGAGNAFGLLQQQKVSGARQVDEPNALAQLLAERMAVAWGSDCIIEPLDH